MIDGSSVSVVGVVCVGELGVDDDTLMFVGSVPV